MVRIRFHGRGGQGMKTASRIVGTAALRAGLFAQDSPVYGAERRGAPMTAYVRIASRPILERGVVAAPPLVVLADDSLLDEPMARPLAGMPPGGLLLIATTHSGEEVQRHTGHAGTIVARDFVAMALARLGTVAGVSTALAAATCGLLDLPKRSTLEAVEVELEAIGLGQERIAASLALAIEARAGISPVNVERVPLVEGAPGQIAEVRWVSGDLGVPSVRGAPNTPERRTGSWRVFRPQIELARCTRCWVCFIRCPDGAVGLADDDTPLIDYAVCKGCLICVEECPARCIALQREGRDFAEALAR